MRARRPFATATIAVLAALAAAVAAVAAHAELPAVARARYASGYGLASGTVFFLAAESGPVAVAPAHSFEIGKLAASPELVFELGHSRTRVASAGRLLIEPGAPLGADGGSLATDVIAFALDAPPAGVQVLSPAQARARMPVRVLGIPGSLPRDQDAIAGRVVEANAEQLAVELETFYDLRGWGGAPIVARDGGGVVGFVQAAEPRGRTLRVLATPIAAVTEALRFPLEDGRGRVFASLAASPAPADPTPEADAAASPAPVRQVPPRPVSVEIEVPADQSVVGGEAATFVAGRALAKKSAGFTTDVVFAIDVSQSTSAPSGADVNGNGIVGAPPDHQGGGLLGLGSSDPGDSILAAEIAAVRRFLTRLDRRYTRVALVSFAGEALETGQLADDPARTEIALGDDYEAMQRALDRVLARGPRGGTHMAAGVDRATIELLGTRSAFSKPDPKSQKVVVFLTDGVPTLPHADDDAKNILAVLEAATRARRAHVRVFTYGVGDEALDGPLALVDLAEITDGGFTPVRDPARLSDLFAEVHFSDVDAVEVRNATAGATAPASELGADGSYGAWVPLRPGRNEIEVTAREPNGGSGTRRVTVHYAPDAPSPALPPALVASRNRVLDLHLTLLRRERIASEQQQVEALRKQLALEIERERAQAVQRAARQRKQLEIEIEPEVDAARP
jgi:hypothetical protein